MRKPLLIVAALLAMAGCSFGRDKQMAEQGVAQFRRMVEAGDYDRVYETASPQLKQVTSQTELTRVLGVIRDRLGPVRQADQTGFHVSHGTGGIVVNLTYATQFASDRGTENFVFRISDGEARLVSYNVNSPALLAAPAAAAPTEPAKPQGDQP